MKFWLTKISLIAGLAAAKKRGVSVEVILDQNVDYVALRTKDIKMVTGKNWEAYFKNCN